MWQWNAHHAAKYRLRKSKMHCFLYQKRTKNRYTAVYLWHYEHRNHKTICKQCAFNKSNRLQTKKYNSAIYRLPKKSKALFLVPKWCKFAVSANFHIKQFFNAPTSKGYTKLVARSSLTFAAINCTPNSHKQPSTGC